MTPRDDATQLETALQAGYAQENAALDARAHAAFPAVHARLMHAIEADREAAPFAPTAPIPSPKLTLLPPESQFTRRHFTTRRAGVWRLAAAAGLIALAGWGGHRAGRQSAVQPSSGSQAVALPVQSLEDDFDQTLHAPAPVEFVSDNGEQAASWLSQRMGRPVRLPRLSPARGELRLLGASRRALGALGGQAVAQAHYSVRGGARVTLYQLRAPHLGLSGLHDRLVGGRHFFVQDAGRYRTVVWRAGDDVLAIVSPLGTRRSLALAASLRAASPDDVI